MSARLVLILCALTSLSCADAASAHNNASSKQISKTKSAKAKSHSRRHSSGRRISARLVPPPPAYMPSILPEHYYHGSTTTIAEADTDDVDETTPAKPKNPYAKYFYSREGNVPKATQARSGVTTWGTIR